MPLRSFSRTTVNRRIQAKKTLSAEYSERIMGLQKLVELMVAESDGPAGFNAAHWVAEWLERPLPPLPIRDPLATNALPRPWSAVRD
jgi:uncharacterized protein (DUF2384 family)